MDLKSLEEYMRHINKQGRVKLHLWSRSKITSSSITAHSAKAVYLRVTLPGLLVAFLDIEEQVNGGYQILLITVFGVRERVRFILHLLQSFNLHFLLLQKMPHASSDFSVFTKLSQFLTTLLQAHPEAEIPTIIVSPVSLLTDKAHRL